MFNPQLTASQPTKSSGAAHEGTVRIELEDGRVVNVRVYSDGGLRFHIKDDNPMVMVIREFFTGGGKPTIVQLQPESP